MADRAEPANYVLQASGNSNPITNPGAVAKIDSAVRNQQLGVASAQAQGTNNNTGSNPSAGFTPPPSPPSQTANNGAPVTTDLSRVISEGKKQDFVEVGTSVNYKNEITGTPAETIYKGTPSIINDYWLVRYHESDSTIVTKFGDEKKYKGITSHPEYKNPTTSKIIAVFNGENSKSEFSWPEKKYTYSDFLYLKHYHPYNNNRLITLRRFLAPVFDNCRSAIQTNSENEARFRTPTAKAISYLGTSENKLSTLTNFTVTIKTKEVTGNLSDKPTMIGATEFANLKQFIGKDDKSTQNSQTFGYALLAALSGTENIDEATADRWASAMNMWETGPYQDLVYGPVNVITGARVRDRGLTYTHALNLNFEYSTKYIERINPKAAMLDIISNMLALSYHHANFYGGENRFQFDRTNYPFLNNQKAVEFLKVLGSGSETEALKKYADELKSAGSNAATNIDSLVKAFGQGGQGFNDPAVVKLTKNAAQIANTLNPSLAKLNKTVTEGTKSTLNGAPTGEWHLQVGNPFAPIMMLGNLWCTQATFTFNDDLSGDDFPTELKVAIKLDYGRQRDSSDIQSMFNAGGGRIYYPYKNKTDANASSTFYNTEYIYNDKPSENTRAYNQQTGVTSATLTQQQIGSSDITPPQKIEPKTSTTKVANEAFQSQNQSKVRP